MGNEILVKESPSQPGRRERWLAALAHASILVYLLGSLSGQLWICCILPLLLPFLQAFNTRKDKWVLFHVWQAAIYQVILLCITVLGSVIFGIPAYLVIFTKCAPGFGYSSSACKGVFLPSTMTAILVIAIVPLVMVFFGVFGSFRLLAGKEFGVPFIAKPLRNWLKVDEHT
jgi:hypothetical protein